MDSKEQGKAKIAVHHKAISKLDSKRGGERGRESRDKEDGKSWS